ncbi:MAG: phospholipase D-like domain-containing protein [Cellulosilyticaceae bacterium]
MQFEYIISDIYNLITYINKTIYDNCGWEEFHGNYKYVEQRYIDIIENTPYNWYFCRGLSYSEVEEFTRHDKYEDIQPLVTNLETLKMRLEICKGSNHSSINVQFDNIKESIIKEIYKARLSMNIAVAWLSDSDICEAIMSRVKDNIDIRIIMIDCSSNKNTKLSKIQSPQIRYAKEHGVYSRNYMHNKFCIFDDSVVITGSFNWSSNANYNYENAVIVLNNELAMYFKIEFNKLWNEYGEKQ